MRFRTIIILITIGILVISLCWYIIVITPFSEGVLKDVPQRDSSVKQSENTDTNDKVKINKNTDSSILALTERILTALKANDFATFVTFIHPTLGVRFSPYAYIDTVNDIRLTAIDFLDKIKNKSIVTWGSYDGSGEPILLTTENYFKKFVYNADFLNAEQTNLNKMVGGGNSLNNLTKTYKGCNYTESYFPGFDKKYDGMDWCCLRLVYARYHLKYYLIAIVHDQWTI